MRLFQGLGPIRPALRARTEASIHSPTAGTCIIAAATFLHHACVSRPQRIDRLEFRRQGAAPGPIWSGWTIWAMPSNSSTFARDGAALANRMAAALDPVAARVEKTSCIRHPVRALHRQGRPLAVGGTWRWTVTVTVMISGGCASESRAMGRRRMPECGRSGSGRADG